MMKWKEFHVAFELLKKRLMLFNLGTMNAILSKYL